MARLAGGRWALPWTGCAVVLLAAGPVLAQYGGMGGDPTRGGFGGPGRRFTPESSAPRAVAPPPPQLQRDSSPRLEPGALLCGSAEALRRRTGGGGAAPVPQGAPRGGGGG